MSELLVPFAYEYMLKAMFVSALVGAVCAFLSAYLMLKGWSLMGDALGHAVVPGVAAAYLMKVPYAAGAFFAGLLAAIGMAVVKQHTRLREDAIIGLVVADDLHLLHHARVGHEEDPESITSLLGAVVVARVHRGLRGFRV